MRRELRTGAVPRLPWDGNTKRTLANDKKQSRVSCPQEDSGKSGSTSPPSLRKKKEGRWLKTGDADDGHKAKRQRDNGSLTR